MNVCMCTCECFSEEISNSFVPSLQTVEGTHHIHVYVNESWKKVIRHVLMF